MNSGYEKFFIGDSCLSWSFGNKIDKELNTMVLTFYKNLKLAKLSEEINILDIVPSYKSITVYYDLANTKVELLDKEISQFFDKELELYNPETALSDAKIIEVPVVYDGDDLERIANLHNLSVQEVINLHTAKDYQVALVGFKPYFPYLIGLDEKLITPRLDNPRVAIPAGSVAIGGAQTGIYPEVSPGGWNLLGRTNPELLKEIKPGDIIKFKESTNI